jgi:hypothetical protein
MKMLALLCIAVVGMGGGARLVSVLLTMFLVWATLQLGYLLGSAHEPAGSRCEPGLFRIETRRLPAKTQPTHADKKNLSDQMQQRYKPLHVGQGKCGGTRQIAACSASWQQPAFLPVFLP